MKVLMLGWEWPPHISGGLATACYGLTQGLAHHGVEVVFVVPRAYGDEDQRFVRVIGANQIKVRESRTEQVPTVQHAVRQRVGLEFTSEPEEIVERATRPVAIESRGCEARVLDETLRILSRDEGLRPYLGEAGYLEALAEATGLAPAELRRRFALAHTETRRTIERLRARLVQAVDPLEIATFVEETTEHERTYEFSGLYGPDLMSEVARYALVVGQLAQSESFDVVHAHDWMTYPAGIVAARLAGVPLVVHMHACEYDRSGENVNERVRGLEQLGLYAADRIVCVSHYTANMLRQRFWVEQDKLRVVHNAVTHREQVEGWHWEKRIEEPIVLFLGRVTFQKGPDYFLEAAARVIKIEPRVKFVMSGSGDMLPKMIERAARLGLARHVHFTGFLKGDEVERMYAMADIYVMPSVSEPFGISPLEAMALDVPVILSRQSGVSEVLRNALKVDFWDVQDMANKILALLRYPALGTSLLEDGREEVSGLRWDFRGALLHGIYRELVP